MKKTKIKQLLFSSALISFSCFGGKALADEIGGKPKPYQEWIPPVMEKNDDEKTIAPRSQWDKLLQPIPDENKENIQLNKNARENPIVTPADQLLGYKIKQNKGIFHDVTTTSGKVIKAVKLTGSDEYAYFNFFPHWKPEDNNATDKIPPKNIEVINPSGETYPISDKNTGKVIVNNLGDDKVKGITFIGFDPASGEHKPQNFGVRYKRVGTLNGREVDLSITCYSYIPYTTKKEGMALTFSTNSVAIASDGFSNIGLRYQLTYSDTGKTVSESDLKKTGWYLNFSDIDARQGVKVYDSSNNIIGIYGYPSNKDKYDAEAGNYKYVHDVNMIMASNTDKIEDDKNSNTVDVPRQDALFDAIIDSFKPNFYFRWTKDNVSSAGKPYDPANLDNFAVRKADSSVTGGYQVVGGEYLAYSGKKSALSHLQAPVKEVFDDDEPINDSDNDLETSNTLKSPKETYSYRIKHTVPNESLHYSTYQITDTLPDNIEIVPNSVKVMYPKTETTYADVNSGYYKTTISNENGKQKISVDFNQTALSKDSFYNQTYVVQFKVKPKTPKTEVTYTNEAYAHATYQNINLGNEKSNPVTTKTPSTVNGDVKKYQKDNGNWTTSELTGKKVGDKIHYKIDYKIPNNVDFNKLHLWDDIPNEIDIDKQSVKLYLDGKLLDDDDDTLTIDENNEKIDWISGSDSKDDYDKYANHTISLEFDGTLKESAVSDIGKTLINNSTIDLLKGSNKNSEIQSNDVKISTIKSIAPKISKFVMDGNNPSSNVNNVACGDNINYELDVTIPQGKPMNTVQIKDDLDNRIDLTKVEIFDGNNNVTLKGTLSIDDNNESFIWKLNNPNEFSGKKLKIKISGKLKYSYEVHDNEKIHNKAQLIIDGKPLDSNDVTVTPNVIEPSAEKWIITKK